LDDELASEVAVAIASLPPLQREALVLFEYEELSLAEIGEVVGVDANTVKARLFRAREKLRAKLERYFRAGPEAATLNGRKHVRMSGRSLRAMNEFDAKFMQDEDLRDYCGSGMCRKRPTRWTTV
jgi:hypothetical protein